MVGFPALLAVYASGFVSLKWSKRKEAIASGDQEKEDSNLLQQQIKQPVCQIEKSLFPLRFLRSSLTKFGFPSRFETEIAF